MERYELVLLNTLTLDCRVASTHASWRDAINAAHDYAIAANSQSTSDEHWVQVCDPLWVNDSASGAPGTYDQLGVRNAGNATVPKVS